MSLLKFLYSSLGSWLLLLPLGHAFSLLIGQDPRRTTHLWASQDPARIDMSFSVGSGQEEDLDSDELNFRDEQAARKAKIALLLEQQDAEFKEERRRQKWGKFANATSKEEIQALEQEERVKIAQGMKIHVSHCLMLKVNVGQQANTSITLV
jgi:hypothetical protein